MHPGIRHGAFFLGDGTIVFIVGHNVVLHHLETKTQRFIPGLVESDGITAAAISSQRRHLALAEKNDNTPIVIFDLQTLKRRKVLVAGETASKVVALTRDRSDLETFTVSQDITCLSFSQDGKLLAAQSGAPDWNLTVWLWEKAKLVATVRIGNERGYAIHHVSLLLDRIPTRNRAS